MNYKILESIGVEIENIVGAQFNNLVVGNNDCIAKGVLNECLMSAVGNILYIDTGLILIKGFRIKITEQASFTLTGTPSVLTAYQLVARLTLSQNRAVVVEMFVRPYQALVKDDILKTEQGTYEVEIATFNHNTNGNISELLPKLETFTLGSSVEVDSELNAESTNPVQNKVIKEALSGKINVPTTPPSGYGVLGTGYQDTNVRLIESYPTRVIGNSIPMYMTAYPEGNIPNGALLVNTLDDDKNLTLEQRKATNKNYIDNQIADINEALDGKLDKKVMSGAARVYGMDRYGNDSLYLIGYDNATSGTNKLAMYLTDTNGAKEPTGKLISGIPTQPYQVAPKQYVDEQVENAGGGLYLHRVTLEYNVNDMGFMDSIMFKFLSSDATPITNFEQITNDILNKYNGQGYAKDSSSGMGNETYIDFDVISKTSGANPQIICVRHEQQVYSFDINEILTYGDIYCYDTVTKL